MPLATDRRILLNALPYGHYELAVGSVDGTGKVIHEVYRLPLTIRPPWYLSVGAKVGYVVLALFLLWSGFHFYLVKKRLNEEKEKYLRIVEQQKIRSGFFNHLSNELKKLLVHIIVPTE